MVDEPLGYDGSEKEASSSVTKIGGLSDLFAKAFSDLNVRSLRALLIFGLILVVILAVVMENQTSFLYFWHLERKIALLKELNSLAKDGVGQNAELSPIYYELVNELEQRKYFPILGYLPASQTFALQFFSSIVFWKFITGAAFGFIFVLVGLSQKAKGAPNASGTIIGASAFGLVGGIIGAYLPIIYSPWVNYLVYPIIVQPIVLLLVSRLVRKK